MLTFDAVVRSDAPDQPTLVVTGDLDVLTAPILTSAALDLIRQPGVDTVCLDLYAVSFIDSTGVNALIQINEIAVRRGVTIEVAGWSRYVERVLRLVGLDALFA